jgi:uncharacterized protein
VTESSANGAAGRSTLDRDTLILQDADNLDALGAVGIARAFAFGGALGQPLWVESEEASVRDGFTEGEPAESTLHHIQVKILRLKESMNTQAGKSLAAARHAKVEIFVKRFIEEWRGEV